MRHGFKTWAERESEGYRNSLQLSKTAPLPARSLATHLGIPVVDVAAVPGLNQSVVSELLSTGANAWSAVTLPVAGKHMVIFNSAHSAQRQESDLMHELAHLICKHTPATIDISGKVPWASRSFNPEQEKEAEWLGACLQITRVGLLWAIKRGMNNEAIAEFYGASIPLVTFRRNTSGVDIQFRRTQKFYGHPQNFADVDRRVQITVALNPKGAERTDSR